MNIRCPTCNYSFSCSFPSVITYVKTRETEGLFYFYADKKYVFVNLYKTNARRSMFAWRKAVWWQKALFHTKKKWTPGQQVNKMLFLEKMSSFFKAHSFGRPSSLTTTSCVTVVRNPQLPINQNESSLFFSFLLPLAPPPSVWTDWRVQPVELVLPWPRSIPIEVIAFRLKPQKQLTEFWAENAIHCRDRCNRWVLLKTSMLIFKLNAGSDPEQIKKSKQTDICVLGGDCALNMALLSLSAC